MKPGSSKRDHLLIWLLRLVVGGAFVVAGVLKIAAPEKFALDVGNYRLLPHELTNLVAILLPWVEALAGILLLVGLWLRPAAVVITGMTVMFLVVIVSALARGLNIECGCFGTVGGKYVGLTNLAIDSTLLCLAALLVWKTRNADNERENIAFATDENPMPEVHSKVGSS
jgi:uncharacterized membrane protein YphA (DoxX/SURF4 family)